MPNLPATYDWLNEIGQLPRMVEEALKLFGTVEQPGPGNNSVILKWAEFIGGDVARDYNADSIPWCGLFMAVVARRAGKTPVAAPLWALNWGKFGQSAGQPSLGDVLTFIRPSGGHVALYIGEDKTTYHVLGGNQSDKVCFTRLPKDRLRTAREPDYMNRPASAKPYLVAADGEISIDEH